MSHGRQVDWLQVCITLGVVLLLFGLQLRSIESFVCNGWSTGVLADWFGPPTETAQGAFQRMAAEKTGHRHVFTPPTWVGWAVLSTGFVLLAHGTWGKWRR